MSTRSERYEFSLAGTGDTEALLRVLESADYGGGISVLYTRRPDPIRSLEFEGDAVYIPVMRDMQSGEIVGMGCCVVRKAYINGEIRNVGYLTGLKVLPAYRNRVPHISKVYEFMHEVTKAHVDMYYTTILKDNHDAQRILEKKRRNMPEYRYCGDYTVYCFKTGKRDGNRAYTLENGYSEELSVFYQEQMSPMNFSAPEIMLQGITDKDICTLRGPDGEILASCSVWNQQSWKQHIVTGYSGIYRYLKNIPLNLIGFPDFPEADIPVNYACITGLCVRGNDMGIARNLIVRVAESRTDVDMLLLGLFENHPLKSVFRHIRHIPYQSRLYTVHWAEDELCLNGMPVNLEVGLL